MKAWNWVKISGQEFEKIGKKDLSDEGKSN